MFFFVAPSYKTCTALPDISKSPKIRGKILLFRLKQRSLERLHFTINKTTNSVNNKTCSQTSQQKGNHLPED